MKEAKAKKKGWLAAIRESMTKTGGCCGPGESCCGPAKGKGKEEGEGKDVKISQKNTQK